MALFPDASVLSSVENLDDVAEALVLQEYLQTDTLELSANISAGESDDRAVDMPFPGYITEVYVRFPNGVDSQVGVNIRSETNGDRVFPSNREAEFLAFNNISRSFDVRFFEQEGGTITVNYDSISGADHFINVVLTAVDTRPLEEVLPDGSA